MSCARTLLPSRVARIAASLAFLVSVVTVGAVTQARDGTDVDGGGSVASTMVADGTLKVSVPGAEGGKTVIGQLTVARATDNGFVTAYPCADGLPRDATGAIDRSDLNYDGRTSPVWSNRLIVEADNAGEVCFLPSTDVEMVIDINAVSFDTGISSFENRRTDTRSGDPVDAGEELRINVAEAIGGRTVIGQLTVTGASGRGYATAYPCEDGIPVDESGEPTRSDVNFDAQVSPARSNRLIVAADDAGDICVTPSERVHLVVDLNGVGDAGIDATVNRRSDTRSAAVVGAGGVLRVNVPDAADSKTVLGQVTAARSTERGFITAFPCDEGVPVDETGDVDRSDVNINGVVAPVWSNRLIVEADDDGDVCFYTSSATHLVVDVNGVADGGITSFRSIRIDTRLDAQPSVTDLPTDAAGTPQWPEYFPLPPVDGVAALTGLAAGPDVTARPVVAYKVDNFRLARPHAGLLEADVVIEVNTEYVSRFIALFHSQTPARVGPVRSARTTDIDLLAGLNRPIFGYSGANPGVNRWLESAARSGVVVDRGAQANGCYARDEDRPGPHNLFADPACMLGEVTWAGPAQTMWEIDANWQPDAASRSRANHAFDVAMGGVAVRWLWDASSGRYLRLQDGEPHLVEGGGQVAADNVVEVSTVYEPSIVDARSPHANTVGSGDAVIHRDGQSTEATWTRFSPTDPYTFRDAVTDAIIPLDVGTTFLEVTTA